MSLGSFADDVKNSLWIADRGITGGSEWVFQEAETTGAKSKLYFVKVQAVDDVDMGSIFIEKWVGELGSEGLVYY